MRPVSISSTAFTPFMALLGLGLPGCGAPTNPGANEPSFELVNQTERPSVFNSHVYGSFAVAAGAGVIRSGPANFPGHPKSGPGTCIDGMWYNPQGKPTSGSLIKPHPHCFSAGAAVEVVLEPLTACYTGKQDLIVENEEPMPPAEPAEEPKPGLCAELPKAVKGAIHTLLLLSETGIANRLLVDAIDFSAETSPDRTDGTGTVTAYAIDASTLGTTNRRVGTLRFDLSQYNSVTSSYLHLSDAAGCSIDEQIESPCLDKVITAVYNPLPASEGGIGPVDLSVEGFLWITPANSPYNYTD